MVAETDENNDGFGIDRQGFSTHRRPEQYWRTMLTKPPPDLMSGS